MSNAFQHHLYRLYGIPHHTFYPAKLHSSILQTKIIRTAFLLDGSLEDSRCGGSGTLRACFDTLRLLHVRNWLRLSHTHRYLKQDYCVQYMHCQIIKINYCIKLFPALVSLHIVSLVQLFSINRKFNVIRLLPSPIEFY